MFGWLGWFKKRQQSPSRVEAIQVAVSAYGDLLCKYPLAICDTMMLPLAREDMKATLKLAWQLSTDKGVRGAIEAAYTSLGQFQDDIGPVPLSYETRPGMSPEEAVAVLNDRVMAAHQKSVEEAERLKVEFEAFKRLVPP